MLEFLADFRCLGISSNEMRSIIPDWDKMIDKASSCRSLLERSGNQKTMGNTAELDAAIEWLMDFRDRILAVESSVLSLRDIREEEQRKTEEFNLAEKARAEDEARIEKERKEDRRYVVSFLLSLAGVVLGISGLAASIYGVVLTLKGP